MKELSIEEKAKAYDKALERAKKWRNAPNADKIPTYASRVVNEIFPELAESEDERIRKEIIAVFKGQTAFTTEEDGKKYIAWLEKQGEQKPIINMKTPEESLGIDSDTYNKIVDECIYGERKPAENKGMNLVEEEMTPFQKKVFCIIDTTIEEEQGLKQVCDELLRLAHDESIQNPAWSEEDASNLEFVISQLKITIDEKHFAPVIDWLKSFKERYTWKPSEEQMNALNDVISSRDIKYGVLSELWEDLKKLREE